MRTGGGLRPRPEVEAGASCLRSELDTVSHDLRQQPLADPAPPGRDRAQARRRAARAADARRPRLFSASGQSPKEGQLAEAPSWRRCRSLEGKSVFLTFAYGVMYVLSFATIITVFATAIALAVL